MSDPATRKFCHMLRQSQCLECLSGTWSTFLVSEVPLRPIVSTIDSPTYNLMKFLTRKVSLLAGKSPTFIKDSGDFVEKAMEAETCKALHWWALMWLHFSPKFPLQKHWKCMIGRRLQKQDAKDRRTTLSVESAKRLLHLWLTSTHFIWNGRFTSRKEDMEHFEELALVSAEFKPATWLCYIYDTFVI